MQTSFKIFEYVFRTRNLPDSERFVGSGANDIYCISGFVFI